MEYYIKYLSHEQKITDDELKSFYEWFNLYVSKYNIKKAGELYHGNMDPYEIKKVHISDVVRISSEIAKNLNLTHEQINLTRTIALFHDIGRFQQYEIYKTFDDSISTDHAILSCKILYKKKILEKLNNITQKSIFTSLSQHNKKELSIKIKPEFLLFGALIRDADKISLFPFFIEKFPEIRKHEKDNRPISNDIYNHVIKHQKIDRNKIVSLNDNIVYILSWFFDINLKQSFFTINDHNYVNDMLKLLPDDNRCCKIKESILEFINERTTNV